MLHQTSVQFDPDRFHVIMGANGAGKSTLLKLLAGEHKPTSGTIEIDGRNINTFSKKELAKKRAVLSQHLQLSFPISAEEVVLMGRYPYFSSHPKPIDRAIFKRAMETMEIMHLAERDYSTLSGGEAQKVQMSRVLAQIGDVQSGEKKVLFLDEPVSHLDVKFQYQLLKAARDLCKQQVTVIAILHDINLAISFADRFLFMKTGRVVYDVNDITGITPGIIQEVFDISSSVFTTDGGKPIVAF